jgi:hypothetical protein
MDIQLVERLAAAGASLEQAQELVEVGGVQWLMIGKVVDLIERLVDSEVRELWLDAVPEGERPR